MEFIFWTIVHTVFGPIEALWYAPHFCERWRPPAGCPTVRLTVALAFVNVGVFFWMLPWIFRALDELRYLAHPKGGPALAARVFARSLIPVAVYIGLPLLFPGSR